MQPGAEPGLARSYSVGAIETERKRAGTPREPGSSAGPGSEGPEALEILVTSSRDLLAAEVEAGVGHHVSLRVVGAGRLPEYGWIRARIAQEKLIERSSAPCSIVRAAPCFGFVNRIADSATDGDGVRVSPVLVRPVAAAGVARAVGARLGETRFEDGLDRSTGQMQADEPGRRRPGS